MTSSLGVPATNPSRNRVSRADETILASKITPPYLPDWLVSRPRISERIDAGRRGPLTLVSGPPGAGKTMAIASWAAAHAELPIAWVTLDVYDNRPQAFWSYLVEAVRRAGVEIPRRVWAPGRHRIDHAFLLRLTAAIEAHGSPVVLVLDDLHLVTEPRPLADLAWLLRNARPYLRLVMASRSDPLLPLHRYRLAGELTEIRVGELAFSVNEAGLLMKQHGITLPAQSLAFLTERAEGWAAALRLAAISMKGHPDPEQLVKEIAAEDSAIASYLVDEVLNTLPAATRSFLLRTSILEEVSADLASEVASAEPATTLPALAQANSLIRPLGGGWYRYHPLLAEILRLKLRRECPQIVPDLHRRAALWLRKNRTPIEAVRQAAAGGDWQLAARIAVDELAVGQLTEPPGIEPLAEVMQRIPQSQDWSEPQPLLVTAALGLSATSSRTVGASLAAADHLLDQIPADEEIPSRLAQAVIRLELAHRDGDLSAAERAAADAAALIGRMPADQLALHPGVSAQVKTGRGTVELWSGHFDQAAATLSAAARAVPDTWQRADCLGHLALVEALRGRLSHAAELAVPAAGAGPGEQAKADESSSCAAMVAMAYVHVERSELSAARPWLRQAEEALELRPDKLIGAVACLVAARSFLARGQAGPALELVARARSGWSPATWLDRRLLLAESSAHAARGNIPSAVDAAREAGAGSAPDRSRAVTRRKPLALASGPAAAGPATPIVVACLSDREREVLQHASEMLGTAEIAAEMFVSVNTVKSHLKSVFRKLGVASRNEAIRRARQLQLI